MIATLPGRSREKIALMANTDGNSWVQDNGVAGMLALGRYYASLPMRCSPTHPGAGVHQRPRCDRRGRSRALLGAAQRRVRGRRGRLRSAIEHLGTREILPAGEGAGRQLAFTGVGEPFLFAAGDSDVLRQTAVAVTQNRNLDRTAVLRGIGSRCRDRCRRSARWAASATSSTGT